jgi:type VII secretion-associated serine protease mycosin
MLVAVVVGAYPQSARADSIRGQEWFLSSLDVARAHSYSEGKGVIVGIVDTGVDASHPDLRGNVLSGIDFSDPSRPGGFGNGETDTASHGTAMAGLIAAHGHGASNGSGITGIAPQAKLLPIRDGTGYLDATATQMATGVIWAVDHGATVICIAEAGYNGSASEEHAIQYAESKDVVVVAGVGNVPASKAVAYPAAYPGVLAAAGTDEHGNHAAISVTGPQVVLSAPATNIYSDGLNHAYSTGTGTSNSTAIIAGAAALVRARFPQLSAVEVIHRLTATATDKGPKGRDDEYGYGELNLVAALTADVPPLPSATKSPTLSHTPEAVKPPAHRTPWLPLTAALVAFLAVLAVWAAAHRRRS